MKAELMTPETFRWVLTILTLGGAVWALYDVYLISKLRGQDRNDPLVKDKRFGFTVGIIIGLFGISGVLRFHGVL
ncbi:MAG: hypothetical protein H0T89_22585 [Deltaproteobacteria bacterium]|nr:hypothetical protein [Deltaproteobacteria bacterium]MDQ3299272.1 hypothetical protein [Myxococcota bacterium]